MTTRRSFLRAIAGALMALPLAAATIRLRETPALDLVPPQALVNPAYEDAAYEEVVIYHPAMLKHIVLAENPRRYDFVGGKFVERDYAKDQ